MQAWWTLVRGGNALLSGAAAWVGLLMASYSWWIPESWLAVLPPILITAAGNIDNDLCDLPTDRLVKPNRPLASGVISPFLARVVLHPLRVGGLLVAWLGGTYAFALALVVVLALIFYNRMLSGRPIAGNVVIAALGALPIVFGALVVANYSGTVDMKGPIVVAVIAFWIHLPREMLKDALDTEGDREAGRLTLPLVIGPLKTARWAGFVMMAAAGYVGWSAFCGCFGTLYAFGTLTTVLPALLLGAAQCGLNPSGHVIERWVFGLKLCMVTGLVWLVLGHSV